MPWNPQPPSSVLPRSTHRLRPQLTICLLAMLAVLNCAATKPGDTETPPIDIHLIGTFVKADFKTLIVPIKRVDRLLLIEARVDTLVGNFILDTGAPGLVLNNTYFRRYSVSADFMAASATQAAQAPVQSTWVNEFELKELRVERIRAKLTEMGHIENRTNTRILGLLGVSILKSFHITLDLHKNILILQQTDKEGTVEQPVDFMVNKAPINKTSFKLVNNSIIVPVTIANKKLLFCLDTGAEASVLSSLLSKRVLTSFTVAKRSILLGTGGTTVEVLAGKLDKITIGSEHYYNMNALVSNLEGLGKAYGQNIDGMIGYDFLTKGIVSISFAKKELCLYPFDEE